MTDKGHYFAGDLDGGHFDTPQIGSTSMGSDSGPDTGMGSSGAPMAVQGGESAERADIGGHPNPGEEIRPYHDHLKPDERRETDEKGGIVIIGKKAKSVPQRQQPPTRTQPDAPDTSPENNDSAPSMIDTKPSAPIPNSYQYKNELDSVRKSADYSYSKPKPGFGNFSPEPDDPDNTPEAIAGHLKNRAALHAREAVLVAGGMK